MKYEIVANSCRICLTKTKKLRSLYKSVDEGDEPPNKMLHLITGIKVEKLDEHETLPKNICKNCELSLSMAFEFRENALKTQQIIAAYLKEIDDDSREENKPVIPVFKSEYEEIMSLEPLDCVDELESNIQNLSNDQNDEELNESVNDSNNFERKDEQYEDGLYNEQGASYFTNDSRGSANEEENTNESHFDHRQKSSNIDQNNEGHESEISEDEIEYTEEHIEITPADEENYALSQNNFKSISTRSNKRNQSKISTKIDNALDIITTENMKLIPRRGRKPSNNTNQSGHICDICGNVFSKRGRMMEHRQRHDKECRFCCEICDKKLLTRELLRKHMFSHSGGKPLKCEFCSRTFYYESVRKAHEAVHKGLRPYICDVCGKGFSYAHALKKHKLIHAEIKLYRCEYCNKDFRLQHHMKQHEHTKLHQNTVRFAKFRNTSFGDSSEVIRDDEMNEDMMFVEEIADEQLARVS